MRKFLREVDQLGHSPQMTFKKNSTFGTSIGGCCSLSAKCLTWSYTIIMLVGFFAERDYDLNFQVLYLDRKDPDEYALSAVDFIPTVGFYFDGVFTSPNSN